MAYKIPLVSLQMWNSESFQSDIKCNDETKQNRIEKAYIKYTYYIIIVEVVLF